MSTRCRSVGSAERLRYSTLFLATRIWSILFQSPEQKLQRCLLLFSSGAKTNEVKNEFCAKKMAIIRKPVRPYPSLKAADREKRAAFLKEQEQFRQQISHQSKECASSLAMLINALQQENPGIAEDLRLCTNAAGDCTGSEKLERDSMAEKIKKISADIASVPSLLSLAERNPSSDVDQLQASLRKINEEIYEAKLQADDQMGKLKMEESFLSGEVGSLKRDMASWNQADAPTAKVKSGAAGKNTVRPLAIQNGVDKPVAVVDYEDFVSANGGTTGGWDDFDHQEFLAFRQRHGPLQGHLIDQAIADIPTKSPSEIVEHEAWYKQHAALFAARKDAVAGWKRKKEEEKEKVVLQQTAEERKQDAAIQQMRQVAHEKQKSRLAIQKAKKEKEEEARRAKRVRAQKEQDEQRRKEFEQHQAQLKDKLEQHYSKLDEQITVLQMKEALKLEEVQERHQQANAVVHVLGERELHKAEEKLSKKQQEKAAKERESQKKEEYVEGLRKRVLEKVGRKPERLTKPTSGWNNRLRSTRAARKGRKASMERVLDNWQTPSSVFDLAKLGIPLWRKESYPQRV